MIILSETKWSDLPEMHCITMQAGGSLTDVRDSGWWEYEYSHVREILPPKQVRGQNDGGLGSHAREILRHFVPQNDGGVALQNDGFGDD